ncbi:MAG: hypothetical protein NT137_00045 [Methanomassiliicoccales archaeon]|nr:hypothetical protein [Methanomassiliicoccales archaeon]
MRRFKLDETPSPEIVAAMIEEAAAARPSRPESAAEKDVRLQFWIPVGLRRSLSEEAAKNGMTVPAWTAYVLAARPPLKIVEQTVLPAGITEELAKIPTLEKRVAELVGQYNALVKKYNALEAERDTLNGSLADLKKRIGTGVFKGKCPGCKQSVEYDLSKELGLLKQPDKRLCT